MPKDKDRKGASGPSPASDAHDGHGTPFKRVSGPGPKDGGKGAAGADAIDRVQGGLERVADPKDRPGERDSDDGE
jgi:hypothetical protein